MQIYVVARPRERDFTIQVILKAKAQFAVQKGKKVLNIQDKYIVNKSNPGLSRINLKDRTGRLLRIYLRFFSSNS
jgi:hypothetical protein